MRTMNLLLIAGLLAITAIAAGCTSKPQQSTDNGGNNLSQDITVTGPDCSTRGPSGATTNSTNSSSTNSTSTNSTHSNSTAPTGCHGSVATNSSS